MKTKLIRLIKKHVVNIISDGYVECKGCVPRILRKHPNVTGGAYENIVVTQFLEIIVENFKVAINECEDIMKDNDVRCKRTIKACKEYMTNLAKSRESVIYSLLEEDLKINEICESSKLRIKSTVEKLIIMVDTEIGGFQPKKPIIFDIIAIGLSIFGIVIAFIFEFK